MPENVENAETAENVTTEPAEDAAAEDPTARRIAALEAELKATRAHNAALESALHPPQPEVREVFVREGQGQCLGCSWCGDYEDRDPADGRCARCGHAKAEHKRNLAGAKFR